MKTLFQYRGKLLSTDLNQALATAIGTGPICGFGRATIDETNGKITLYPTDDSAPYGSEVKDRLNSRVIQKLEVESEGAQVNFACVSRDGAIYTSDAESMTIPSIMGNKGRLTEVIVFAIHGTVTEQVDNPVEYIAYWNSSSISFYEIYKKSIDPYYPVFKKDRSYNIDEDDTFTKELYNFGYLNSMVQQACPQYQSNSSTYSLIGIYGTGLDAANESAILENFALVPYNHKFPMELNFNTAVYSMLKQCISNDNTYEKGRKYTDQEVGNLKTYVDAKDRDLAQAINNSGAPIGSVNMWAGSVAPEGYAICNGQSLNKNSYPELFAVLQYTYGGSGNNFNVPNLQGKFPVGLSSLDPDFNRLNNTGGEKAHQLTAREMPSHSHIYSTTSKHMNVSFSYVDESGVARTYNRADSRIENTVGERGADGDDGWESGYRTSLAGSGQLHNNLPPYLVMNFIIKTGLPVPQS